MPRRYREVMRELVDAVVGGEYAEGTWMPQETDLQARFGCSRGVIREALRGLEERGLVAVHPARGQKVRQREYWDTRDADVLRACIARGPDRSILAQAIDARAAVEREAAVRAIEHATGADLALLAARIADMEAALDPRTRRTFDADDPFVVAEAWFHHTLALLSDNALLAKLAEPLQLVLAELRCARAPDRDRAVIRHHRRILEGVSSREAELAAAAVTAYAEQLARWLGARP
jgi:GntR family transcriptional regulator, transcriptional repressor for pyruvate dehydrogenase complex